jgi:carboxyl-terminal processing protease
MKVSGRRFTSFGMALFTLVTTPLTFAQETVQPAKPESRQKEEMAATEESEDSTSAGFNLEASLRSFDEVWSKIDSVHWDQNKVGPTWDDARAKYRPVVENAASILEVRQALNDMIEELGQSHFGIIPKSSYDAVDNQSRGGDGSAGLDFRATEEGIVVSKVRSDSSAAKAGVKPGWVFESVGKKTVAEISSKLQEAAHGPTRYETLVGLSLPRLASGKVGEKKRFVFRDEQNKTREMELEFEPRPGKKTKFGNLPAMHVESESRTLDGNVGYFRFNAFLDPVRIMAEYRETLRNENHRNGVIIDLRGNIGGLGGMTMGMASEFSDKESSLGVMTTKGSKLKFFVSENYDPVRVPVAVLVDECSVSSAEIFSGGLKDLGIARIFGTRTAGLALPSMIEKLPNGDGFQYAFADYRSASGKSLEKDGVEPDEEIPLSRELLIADPDPVLSRALEWVHQQKQ